MATIAVLGATGYIGGRLVPRLLGRGHEVRCIVRTPEKLAHLRNPGLSVHAGDALQKESLSGPLKGVEVLYYLVHSMTAGKEDFERRDRRAAETIAEVSRASGVKRIIYLGGLGRRDIPQSPHLRSRHEVGEILRASGVPVTEFRAAVIIGSGSASFEMMHHLVNRLPLMICPQWVTTKTQPIAISDVLDYLCAAPDVPASAGETIDIGGPDIVTYRDMMLAVAKALGLKRLLIRVPVLTPRLSSYWVNLVTPVQTSLARALIESLKSETICEESGVVRQFSVVPMTLDEAVRVALRKVSTHAVETSWTSADSVAPDEEIDPSHLHTEVQSVEIPVSRDKVFPVISAIGGDNGWYYADWLWRVRGFIDQQTGGVGLRRGRRHPIELRVGDALDCWRVEKYSPPDLLRLRAEMNVWGKAWLEFRVEKVSQSASRLVQTARYYPRGLAGLLYWYSIYPIHVMVFRGMARAIARRSVS